MKQLDIYSDIFRGLSFPLCNTRRGDETFYNSGIFSLAVFYSQFNFFGLYCWWRAIYNSAIYIYFMDAIGYFWNSNFWVFEFCFEI